MSADNFDPVFNDGDDDDDYDPVAEAAADAAEEAAEAVRQAGRMYTIDTQSKYMMQVTELKNLEDAVDVFYTHAEIQEMIGEDFYGGSRQVVRRQVVIDALTAMKSKLGPTKKSMIIEDVELIEFLNGESSKSDEHTWVTTHSVSDFVKGLRRVGNRLSLHETTAAKAKLNFRLVDKIISVGQQVMTQQLRPARKQGEYYALEFSVKYAYENRVGVLEMLKKLVKWADIEKELPEIDGFVEIAKKVWDDPKANMPVEKKE